MNRSFIVAVLTVTTIIMMATTGYAWLAPHDLKCVDCHGKFSGYVGSTATAATKACVTCHSSMGEASRMPAGEPGSMANFFGTAAGQPSTGSRSTHTWGAVAPYNSASNVLEPSTNAVALATASNSVSIVNTTVCNRCHNVKAGAKIGALLRVSNANDALCLDCHRQRNTSTHLAGSHPVAFRAYSTVYKSNTTAFRRTPLSTNANNKTAQLGNYLSGGKIVCSTCHAPHYADSSSATLDNRSTANGVAVDDPAKGLKGSLQNSKGQLLRTDAIGSTATAINVCSACHKETKNKNHNGVGQNIQCGHCHSAHVDYTGDGTAPNRYLVRRNFSNMTTDTKKLGANVKVIYNNNTTVSLRFMRSDGKGICQICHTPPPGIAIHDNFNAKTEDCLGCHKHSDGFAVSDCSSCHGQPPMANYLGGPKGKAAPGYTLDEAKTPHASHADAGYYNYACKNCHYEGTRPDSHNTLPTTGSATFQSVFIDTAGSVGALAGYANVPANYDSTAKTCALVYCHSNGNPRAGSIAWKSATTDSWLDGKNKIIGTATECTSCHESGATLVTNAHYAHAYTNKIKCSVCHYSTVTDSSSIKDRTKHVNGTKDVVFVTRPSTFTGGAFDASFNSADATCTNSCHTNGVGVHPLTPAKWTDSSTGACGTCHLAVPDTTLHPLHFTGTTGPKLGPNPDCSSCHVYSAGAVTHVNGVVNLKSGNSCAPCHQAGIPIWSTSATVTCESCHTGTASVVRSQFGTYTAQLKSLNNSVGHGQYSSATTLKVKCASCHNASAAHIGAGASEKRLSVAGNALCSTCHISSVMGVMSTARANMPTHGGLANSFATYTAANRTTAVSTRSQDCAGCHDTHGTTNRMSIRTVINGKPISFKSLTSFTVSSKTDSFYNGLCQACHTKTKYYRNYTSPAAHNIGTNCLDCHKHKGTDLMFAFQPFGGCGDCHGYPPVSDMTGRGIANNYSSAKLQDYAGGGGAHSVNGHISPTANPSQGFTNCTNCHFNTASHTMAMPLNPAEVTVVVDPQFKFNNLSTIRYNASTCSNVSCHFKPSPNWMTGL